MENEPEMYVAESPLKLWPGEIRLVHPDEFTGTHWNRWREIVDEKSKKHTTINRLMCYAGLEFLRETDGVMSMDMTPQAVLAWESNPQDEKMKLVSWLGRTFQEYIREVTDPKG